MSKKLDDAFEISPEEPVFTTGVISRLLKIPVHVLKQLDICGIVSPPRERRKARLYSRQELKKIERCWYYIKERKVKISDLKVIFELEEKIKGR